MKDNVTFERKDDEEGEERESEGSIGHSLSHKMRRVQLRSGGPNGSALNKRFCMFCRVCSSAFVSAGSPSADA